jgi:putative aldouronate transport system substrate-binding protein
MKRMMMIVTSILVMTGLLFAAGQQQGGAATESLELSDPGVFPIVQEQVTLEFFAPQHAIVEDMATNTMTMYMQDLTNVHIEWETVPQQAVNEKRTLLLASGDYPDVLFSVGITPDEEMIYGGQGVFLSLNDLIDEYTVELQKVFTEQPLVKPVITTPDGNIYGLPQINQCYHCFFSQKAWINREWLGAVGMEMPTTTDEMYQVLKAFKTQDPNGNGKVDEIPISGAVGGWHTQFPAFFMNAFIYYGDDETYLEMENDTVGFVANRPEYREGLKYVHKLYSEGLIDPAAFTQDGTQLRSLGENPDEVVLGSAIAGWFGIFTKNGAPSNRFTLYDAVPPLEGPEGVRTTGHYPFGITRGNYVITNECDYPAVAVKWADHLYSQEATLRSVFGREGEEWVWAKPGDKGLNGEPAIWERLSTFGSLQNYHWAQMGPSYRPTYLRLGEKAVPDEDLMTGRGLSLRLYRETKAKYDVGIVPDQVYPPVYMTKEQASEIAQLRTALSDYIAEANARFIIGELDPHSSDWDDFVKELDKIGVARYVELNQEAYNAQYK